MSEEQDSPLPETTDAWRALLATISHRDLFRLIQSEKAFPASLLTGFRPTADAVRRPVVVERLAKFLLKQPALAGKVVALPRAEPKQPTEKQPTPPPLPPRDDSKLKEKVRDLRAQLQERQRHCTQQESLLSQALAERDSAREAVKASQQSYTELVEKVERERRQRETKPLSTRVPKASASHAVVPIPTPIAAVVGPLEEALMRLLQRGKHPMVAGLCRELLLEEGLEAPLRGSVHGLYATALVGLGQEYEAAEQERLATEAFLDAGWIERASEALARSLTHRTEGAFRSPERATLHRFLALTARAGFPESALLPLRRLRILAPGAFRTLHEALQHGGKKHATTLAFLSATAHQPLGATEPVALPSSAKATATVTAQSLVRAVVGNDEELIHSARRGLVALHETSPALADALLESIAQLAPFAVFPFVRPRLRPIVVDASNVARYVADPLAQLVQTKHVSRLAPLLVLREHLLQRGYFPILMIADANLRHHIDERATYVQLVEQHTIRETPAGTEADEALLAEARARQAPLVTRDRFVDWGDAAREVERLSFEIYPGRVALIAD